MLVDGHELRYDHGLWLGTVSSRFGVLEVLLDGSQARPDEHKLAAFRRFSAELNENIANLRKRICCGFLYQPIRIAINNEKRVGVQFRNRLTGRQDTLIQE